MDLRAWGKVGRGRRMKILSTESQWGKAPSEFSPLPKPHKKALAEASEENLRLSPQLKRIRDEDAWVKNANIQKAWPARGACNSLQRLRGTGCAPSPAWGAALPHDTCRQNPYNRLRLGPKYHTLDHWPGARLLRTQVPQPLDLFFEGKKMTLIS